jgi:hypothetical protein
VSGVAEKTVTFSVKAEIVLEVIVCRTENVDEDRAVAEELAQEYIDRRIQEREREPNALFAARPWPVRIVSRETKYPEEKP